MGRKVIVRKGTPFDHSPDPFNLKESDASLWYEF
jgi:hypothetical protein